MVLRWQAQIGLAWCWKHIMPIFTQARIKNEIARFTILTWGVLDAWTLISDMAGIMGSNGCRMTLPQLLIWLSQCNMACLWAWEKDKKSKGTIQWPTVWEHEKKLNHTKRRMYQMYLESWHIWSGQKQQVSNSWLWVMNISLRLSWLYGIGVSL